MKKNNLLLISLLACALASCSGPKDTVRPEILPLGEETSPLNCQVFRRGLAIPVAYLFTDNEELGSYSLSIHPNFDHHTHSTEAETCPEEEHHSKEEGPDAWKYIKEYTIPSGRNAYEASHLIPIPENAETGEYHFVMLVSDAAGWTMTKSVSIHIEE